MKLLGEKMKNKLESAIIVKNEYGYVATIHYFNRKYSRYISAPNKQSIYNLVEKYIKKVSNE